MSTYSRAKSKRQQRHSASRSRSSQEDKRQGDARRRTDWVAVDAPQCPSPTRSFTGLDGHECINNNGEWTRCEDPEDYGDYLESEAVKRSWYMDRTTRKGEEIVMKRSAGTPLEIVTITFPPWLSQWVTDQKRDYKRKLAEIRAKWLQRVCELLVAQRYILGFAFHANTDDLHFDLALTRQDGQGGRIGQAGLGLAGPWSTAVDRQLRAGAVIHSEKHSQYRRNVAAFRGRHGQDAMPLDVALARALDDATDQVLGQDILPYRTAYAESVPGLERKHATAQLQSLDAARERLRERAAEQLPTNDKKQKPNKSKEML